jgi:hypothetical protein
MKWRLVQPLLLLLLSFAVIAADADTDTQTGIAPVTAPPSAGSTGAPSAVSPAPLAAPPSTQSALPPTGSIGSAVPVPTDVTPPEVALPPPIPLGEGLLIGGAVDTRYRTASRGRTGQIYLNEAEIDIDRPFDYLGQPIGDVHLQLMVENPPDDSQAAGLQIGEAYAVYKLPFQTQTDSTVYLKLGQFQLPFGLLAVYDPHLQILQPLYAQSIGLRTDFGMEVSGRFYGVLNYDFSLTTGQGPDHLDITPHRVAVFRLGRTFVTRNGTVNVGGSLLEGYLPVTDLTAAEPTLFSLPPSGYVDANRGYISKTRIAGDGTIIYKAITARGEAMYGADQNSRVLGYYAEVDYRFSPRAQLVGAHSLWDYPQSNSESDQNAFGVTYSPDSRVTLRALYQLLYNVPVDASAYNDHVFTVQALFRF